MASYGSSFFPSLFSWPARFALGPLKEGKNLVHNLAYGPRTRLIRGIYTIADNFKLIQAKQQFSFILLVYCTHARSLFSRFVAAVSSNAINLKSSMVKSCVSVVAFKILPSKH